MRDMSVPGAVVLVRTPAGQYLEAFGTRRAGTDDPVEVGDHFRIGSNTKTMTGTVVLQLVQEGRIGLTDPVAKYQPQVPNGADITIAQMLDMRSGLYNYTELESVSSAEDLATYVKPHVTGDLLDAATQRQRIDSLPPTPPANGISASYGLALARFGPMIDHDGSLPGYQSFMGYDPDGGNTLIVLTNLQAAPDCAQPANEIAKRLIAQL